MPDLFTTSASKLSAEHLRILVDIAKTTDSSITSEQIIDRLSADDTRPDTIKMLHNSAKAKFATARQDPTRMFTTAAVRDAWDRCESLDDELLADYGLSPETMRMVFRVDCCGGVVSMHASKGSPTGSQADHWFPHSTPYCIGI